MWVNVQCDNVEVNINGGMIVVLEGNVDTLIFKWNMINILKW